MLKNLSHILLVSSLGNDYYPANKNFQIWGELLYYWDRSWWGVCYLIKFIIIRQTKLFVIIIPAYEGLWKWSCFIEPQKGHNSIAGGFPKVQYDLNPHSSVMIYPHFKKGLPALENTDLVWDLSWIPKRYLSFLSYCLLIYKMEVIIITVSSRNDYKNQKCLCMRKMM